MNENYINHVALVLDASSSMGHLTRDVVKVADDQIAYLAQRSTELDQETRVSVYVFADRVQCIIFDKDVLRMPSLVGRYRPSGMTALIDGTMQSQEDLHTTSTLYGDHAFLTFVLTDGQENASRRFTSQALAFHLAGMADNYTLAILVPDQRAKFAAKAVGFPADNIAIWDTTSSAGIREVGETIRTATENFMVGRQSGVRGSRSVFSTGADAVNTSTVKSTLTPLAPTAYRLVPVPRVGVEIRPFVQECGFNYVVGNAYYELSKTETIQPQKAIIVVEKATDKAYTGRAARDLIGLPDMHVRVKPDYNPDYKIFCQSTSVNRKLVAGTQLLIMV